MELVRAVFFARYSAGLSWGRVAEVLGVGRETARRRFGRRVEAVRRGSASW